MKAPASDRLQRLAELEAERQAQRLGRQFRPPLDSKTLEVAKFFFASGFIEGALTPLDAEHYERRIKVLEDLLSTPHAPDNADDDSSE